VPSQEPKKLLFASGFEKDAHFMTALRPRYDKMLSDAISEMRPRLAAQSGCLDGRSEAANPFGDFLFRQRCVAEQ
jgi:hypothetical protein